jgi:hypothetical protein
VNEGLFDAAPDEPPSGGFPERRQDQRRTDDRLAHDMEGWVARLFIYRGRIIALVSSVTFLLTALGFRIIGPSQDIKALDQKFSAKDSIMSARVTRIEDSQGQIKGQLQALAESMRFLTYMACQATDRDRRPATCYVVAKEIP